jgi:hypothetical protein
MAVPDAFLFKLKKHFNFFYFPPFKKETKFFEGAIYLLMEPNII